MRTPDHACSTIASVHSSSRRPNLISKRAGEEGLKNPGPNFDLLAPETRARRSTASPGEKTGARLEWKRGQSRRRCRTDPDPICSDTPRSDSPSRPTCTRMKTPQQPPLPGLRRCLGGPDSEPIQILEDA